MTDKEEKLIAEFNKRFFPEGLNCTEANGHVCHLEKHREALQDFVLDAHRQGGKDALEGLKKELPEERLERWTINCCPVADEKAISFNAALALVAALLDSKLNTWEQE